MKYTYWLVFILISCVISCKENKTIYKDGMIIEGNFSKDTIFDGRMFFYDSSRKLLAVKTYKEGLLEDTSIEYHENGKIRNIMVFTKGMKNGSNVYFDTSGSILYEDFYYFNLTVGPIKFFDKMGQVRKFFFSNLQDETILEIDYLNWKGIGSIYDKCINFTVNTIQEDSTKKESILLYLIKPPKISFRYSIVKKRKVDNEQNFREVEKINQYANFITITIPTIPKDEDYAIALHVYDSILNKNTVIYKEL